MATEEQAASPPVEEHEEMSNSIDLKDEDDPLLESECVVIRQRKWAALPEVPTFLYFLALMTQYPVQQFWLFDYFSAQYKFDNKNNLTDYCANSSDVNNSYAEIENDVQTKANNYIMYTGFVTSFTAIFPTLFLGPFTDKYGRKFVFYICLIALFVSLLLNLLIFLYQLSPDLLFICSFVVGLSGSYGLLLAGSFGIVADITTSGKQRALRVAVMEAAIAVASSLGITTSGIWVRGLGYVWPIAFSLATVGIATLFVIFIPETFVKGNYRPFSCRNLLKCFEFFWKDTPDKRRFKLSISLVVFLITVATINGETNFAMLYFLHRPFCWSKMEITIFNGVLILLKWIFVMIFIVFGTKWIPEPIYALIGCFSAGGSYLLRGIAQNDVPIFIGAGVSLMTELVSPMCRTMMSKMVSQNEQGALFSSMGVLQMVVAALAGIIMSAIYNVGLDFFLGLPYIVLASLSFIAICLLLVLIIRRKMYPEQELVIQEEAIIN